MVKNAGIAGRDYVGVSVGALIVDDDMRILLLKRKKSPEENCWSIPGGMVEYSEKVENALIREIKEELGVVIKVKSMLCVVDNIIEEKMFHTVSISYLVDLVSGELKNMEMDKHSAMSWFSINNLPEKLTISTKEALRIYDSTLKKRNYR